MDLFKDTPLEVAWQIWQPSAGRSAMTVVVKATFDLPAEGPATLAAEQRFVTGDEHHDDDVERSLAWASDLELLKPRGECYVVGSCHVPHGLPVERSAIAFTIGPIGKQLAVIGDRAWRGAGASEPAAFSSMPLEWERSFGGPGIAHNPIGRGLAKELPNIEDPAALVQSPGQRPRPAGCAPIPRSWFERARWAGTYDARWLAERYPGLADDVDYRLFLCAPEDQRIDGFWTGEEEIRLRHLHPTHPQVNSRLPGIRAQAFLTSKQGALTDVGLRLDTIALDADAGQVCCLWRGLTDVDPALEGIEHLFVVHQEPGQSQKLADYAAWYLRALAAAAREAAGEEPEDAPEWPTPDPAAAPVGTSIDPAALMAELAKRATAATREPEAEPPEGDEQPFLDPDAPGAKWAHLDQAMTARGDDTALVASLAAEIAKRRVEERSAAFRPVFDNALGFETKEEPTVLSPEELLALEMADALGDFGDEPVDDARQRVKEAVRGGESCAGWELHGVNLSGVELSGGDFTGAVLVHANLSGIFARGATFDGASLVDCELSHAVFEDCSFVETDMSPVRAESVRMKGCRLDGSIAIGSYFRKANFLRCTFAGAELSSSDLAEAHFEECTLDGSDFTRAELPRARFVKSTLIDVWFEGVIADESVFDRCDCSLLRASEGASFNKASFKGAKLDGARFSSAALRSADFSLASMERADLVGAFLAQARLMGCNLRAARLDDAVLVQASLLKSNLHQARLENANLEHADLRGCNLFQAELLGAKLADARFDLAFLHGTRIA